MYGMTMGGYCSDYGYGYGSGFDNYGWGGVGGFYGGGWGVNVEGAKDNIRGQYDISTTWQSYGNRQNVEGMSQAQRSRVIAELLIEGKSNDIVSQFNALCKEVKASGGNNEYPPNQIKAIAAEVYRRSTGEDLVEAIKDTTPDSFTKGLENGIPIIGTFFTDNTSREDLLAKITGKPKRVTEQVGQSIGAGLSGLVGGVAIGAGASLIAGVKIGALFGTSAGPLGMAVGVLVGGIIGLALGIGKSLHNK